ncbi:phosphatase [Paenibacillus yonginensis]|uniref:Phosphatase n=1 Tax=Paenibacillus yonginensis TaxID=1462996 RepID=A0A1B1MYP2_9BACL|nr:Cof-type HAD-IIB family hydrolase [Paenibacillus yonginensis]ANS74276.1 phosphatase [Paenibacillus yonginensis]
MTERSIIFFDIDGTLLGEDKKVPASAKEAVFALKRLGHEVAIATGRAPFMFKELRKELEIETYVSYNGQYVVLQGEPIYRNPLDKVALQQLTDLALQRNHPVVYMDHEDMKVTVPDHEFVTASMGTLKIHELPAHDPLYYQNREIYQSLLFCVEGEEQEYEQQFKAFDLIRWHSYSADVIPAGGSKAKGIAKITGKLGIPAERQYAFGDGLNDIEMLSQITNSVAMGNGVPEAKAAAKYVTKAADDGGILHGLQMVGLL